MKDLFLKRKQAFRKQCLGYLRYVLNDHFVLFLLILLGFLTYQYSQLLQHFPENHLPIYLFLGLVSIFLLAWGNIATYIEGPDKIFLIVNEAEVKRYIKRQAVRSFVFWLCLQTVFLLLLAPLFLAMNLGMPIFIVYLVILGLGKYLIFQRKIKQFIGLNGLDWDFLILQENKRKQILLRFFALFTQVKGISNSVKRCAYLDVILRSVPKTPGKVWQNLYLRSYLRNGDLFGLSVRLLLLSILSLIFINQAWIAAAVVALFNYLLLFQLLALYHAFDYQYLTQLFPLNQEEKVKGLKQILLGIGIFVLVLELLVGLVVFKEKIALLILLGVGLVLQFLYIPYQAKRLVDE